MNWIVPVSAAEREEGELSAASEASAREALRKFGCVILRGVFAADFVDRVRAEFNQQWGLTEAEMTDWSHRPPPNPIARVGEGRFEVLVKMKGIFGDTDLFGNFLLGRFLVKMLDNTIKLSGMTVVVSYPGAKVQHVHTDLHELFQEPGVSAALPVYAINVAVPLIDIDRTIGPTAIWLGSHLWESDRMALPEECTIVDFMRGDCILLDYRTWHAGIPNNSDVVRPILYMVYARTWFFDEANHKTRPSLDMDEADYLALPPNMQKLMRRAYAQRLRAAYLTNS